MRKAVFDAAQSVMQRRLRETWAAGGWRKAAAHTLRDARGAAGNESVLRASGRAVEEAHPIRALVGRGVDGGPSRLQAEQVEGGPDPDCRRCFHWNAAHWHQPLFAHCQAAIRRRQSRAELRRGAFVELAAEDGLYAFARYDAGAATVVALNRGHEPATLHPALP